MKKVSLTIELKDQISQALAKIRSGVKSVTEEAGKATGAVKSLTGAFGKLDPVKLESTIGILRDLTGEIAAASGVAFTFSQSIADLSAITGIAGAELEGLEANARRIGKESGLGAAEAARAYTNLASQIDVAKIGIEGLETLQRESITLAQASGMGVAAASDALAGTINQFGLEAGEAARVVNVLAAGSKYGAAEIDDLAASFKAAGSTASVLGVDVEQTAAALEILAQANLKGAESGTALRNVLLFMNTRLGIDFAATSLSDALAALQPRIEDTRYMVKLFGRENIAAAQYLIKNAQAVGEMTEQLTGTDTAAEQAAIRTKSTAHQMEVLRAKVDDLKITLTGAMGSAAPAAALISENATSLAVAYMAVSKFSKGVKAATAAIRGMNAAMRANVIGIIVTAVAALAGGLYYLANRGREAAAATSAAAAAAKDLADISASAARAVAGEASRLEMLNAIVHDNTKGIETRRKAIAEIQKTVPDYHASLDKEGRLLRDNAAAIGKYVEGLKNAAKLQAVKDKLGEIGAQRVDIEMARDAQNRAKAIRRRRAEESVSNAKVYQNGEEQEIKPEVRAAMRGMVTAIADGGKSYNQALDAAIASLQPDGRVTEAAKQLRTAMSGFSTYKPENEGDALWTSTPLRQLEKVNALLEEREGWLKNIADREKEIKAYADKNSGIIDRLVSGGGAVPGGSGGGRETSEASITAAPLTAPKYIPGPPVTKLDPTAPLAENTRRAAETFSQYARAAIAATDADQNRLATLEDCDNLLQAYTGRQRGAYGEEFAALQRNIDAVNAKREALQRMAALPAIEEQAGQLAALPEGELAIRLKLIGEDGIRRSLETLRRIAGDANSPIAPEERERVAATAKEYEAYAATLAGAAKGGRRLTGTLDSMSQLMGNMKGLTDEGTAAWLGYGAQVLSTVSQMLPLLAQVIGGRIAEAFAGAAASSQSVPFPGNIIALSASMAAVAAAVASIPKFADGGIAYGPTLGLFGEYAGASHNPEVVAPLDRLRAIITPDTRPEAGGRVEFVIKGRRLEGILHREARIRERG